MIAVYRDGGNTPPIYPPFFLASALHAAPWLGATQYIFVRLILVFIPVTPLPHYCQLNG